MMHPGTRRRWQPHWTITQMILAVGMMMVMGCATAGSRPGESVSETEEPVQREAADLAFYHSQQAAEFRNLAQRFELEANLLARRLGETDEATLRKRAFAQEMWAEADRAARTAEEYRRQVPQAQLY